MASGLHDPGEPDHVEPGRRWVTREDVGIDRMASALLIVRFIDPQASFAFGRPRGHKPHRGELRFDMFQAEYTHIGEDCTFQTLARRFGLADPAIRAIGEIVHDIDCKDERFGRPEQWALRRSFAESPPPMTMCDCDEVPPSSMTSTRRIAGSPRDTQPVRLAGIR
ncbi:MAG TPA: chromate resistance protein ChrB domain-containing protein [Gemmatimonadales bacterium]|jgi:hypothetical protein